MVGAAATVWSAAVSNIGSVVLTRGAATANIAMIAGIKVAVAMASGPGRSLSCPCRCLRLTSRPWMRRRGRMVPRPQLGLLSRYSWSPFDFRPLLLWVVSVARLALRFDLRRFWIRCHRCCR